MPSGINLYSCIYIYIYIYFIIHQLYYKVTLVFWLIDFYKQSLYGEENDFQHKVFKTSHTIILYWKKYDWINNKVFIIVLLSKQKQFFIL